MLRTAAEVRNAVRYVVGNFASHARRRGEGVPGAWTDPFSSMAARSPRSGQLSLWASAVTEAPETWLLRSAAAARGSRGQSAPDPHAVAATASSTA